MKDIESFIMNLNSPVKEAMKRINDNPQKTLYIVDEQGYLFGSLTDGDLRRWILKNGSLDETVAQVCYKKPFSVKAAYNKQEVIHFSIRNRIFCLPVVDDEHKLVDLLFTDELIGDQQEQLTKRHFDAPVVIMAGGFGTRLEPFTKVLPKPLIPVGNETILEKIIREFRYYGLNDFHVSIHHKGVIIKSYFEEINPDYQLSFIEEKKPLGTIGALKMVKEQLDRDFIVTNCDVLVFADYFDLYGFHRQHRCDITLVGSMMHYKIPYGICEIKDGGELIDVVEKPEYDFLISTGMYVINPEILELIPENTVFHITDLIKSVQENGGKVMVYPVSENEWTDTGNWSEYKNTMLKLGL